MVERDRAPISLFLIFVTSRSYLPSMHYTCCKEKSVEISGGCQLEAFASRLMWYSATKDSIHHCVCTIVALCGHLLIRCLRIPDHCPPAPRSSIHQHSRSPLALPQWRRLSEAPSPRRGMILGGTTCGWPLECFGTREVFLKCERNPDD